MPHGHPGTPVGDLFPPGASVLGAGGGLGRQALPLLLVSLNVRGWGSFPLFQVTAVLSQSLM